MLVIDYTHAAHAIRAQRLLAAGGVGAVYLPYLPVAPPGGGADATHLVVHRIQVADGDARWTRSLLAEHGLLHPTVEAS